MPPQSGVGYIVSWQNYNDAEIPADLMRDDVTVLKHDGTGLSRNRNNAIAHSTADVIYIADDDIELLPGIVENIVKAFTKYPDTQVATFKAVSDKKISYPTTVTDLKKNLPKNYNISSWEIAFRRELFPKLKFNNAYGINSGIFEAGEDELLHLDARKAGMVCRFFPYITIRHPHASTGTRKIKNPKVLHGMGAIIRNSYPVSFLLRIPLKALRLHRSGQSRFGYSFFHLFQGAFKSYFY